MQALLRVMQKQANVQQVRLLPETVVGRSMDCNLKIASTQVSRRHCRILVNDLGVYVEDLCSANGTFLDGKRLLPNQPTLAPAGSQLVIGPATFAVEYRTSTVSRPELGAAIPVVVEATDPTPPPETTTIPVDAVKSVLRDHPGGAPAEDVFSALVTEAVPSAKAPDISEELPRRMRSLFGMFRREKKLESKSTAVPFLPAEVRSEVSPLELAHAVPSGVATAGLVTDITGAETAKDPVGADEPAFDFSRNEASPAEAVESTNPFRQFSQS